MAGNVDRFYVLKRNVVAFAPSEELATAWA
jgi:hypothetical protein